MRAHMLLATLIALTTAACDNSCQQVCDRMARYASDCDLDVTSDDIKECKAAQAGAESRDDRAVCREYNGSSTIRDEWECDDVRAYFGLVE